MPHRRIRFVEALLSSLISFCLLAQFGCQKGNPVSLRDGIQGTVLLETTVNPSSQDAVVAVGDKLTIRIPRGAVPDGTPLTVSEIDPSYWKDNADFMIQKVFEIRVGEMRKFDPPLIITLPFDASKCPPGKFKYRLDGAFLDEANGKWTMFPNCRVDSSRNTLTIETNHLTKLGLLSYRSLWSGYTDYFQTDHFTFYWKTGDVSSNSQYQSPNAAEYAQNGATDPYYVLDIARWAEGCVARYEQTGLSTWSGRVNVFFTRVVDDKGNPASAEMTWDWININKIAESDIEGMQSTIAHEILHLIQDNYYLTLFSSRQTLNPIKWWMEATAVLADRIVWPTGRRMYESEGPECAVINENVDKSWDDCWSDPAWYVAGGFLTYLSVYTPERKASIPELIKRVGDATDVSYIRTIVDRYLKTDLGLEKGIAHEYYDYLMAAYLKRIPIRIQNMVSSPSLSTWPAPYMGCRITGAGDRYSFKQPIPYMSAKIFRVYNLTKSGDNIRQVKITVKSVPDDLEANLFERDINPGDDQITFLKTLWTGDVVTTVLLPKSSTGGKMLEVLVINKNKDKKLMGEPEIEFTVETDFGAMKILPDNLNGYINEEYAYSANTYGAAQAPYNVVWNFGGSDITVKNDTTYKQKWSSGGSFTVKARLLDNAGVKMAETQTKASIFSGLRILPNPLNTVLNKKNTLTASTNWIGVPSLFRLVWNFGDGTGDQIVDNDSTVQHAYSAKGTYKLHVKLWDSKGTLLEEADGSANVTGEIRIEPDPLSAMQNTECTVTARTNGTAPKPCRYIWNFGDGTSDVSVNNDSTAKHTFATAGTFVVSVKLYDQNNNLSMQASGVANIQAQSNTVITSIMPVSAIAGCDIRVYGNWTRKANPPNSYVIVNGTQIRPSPELWLQPYVKVTLPDNTPYGTASIAIMYEGVTTSAVSYRIGIPVDTMKKYLGIWGYNIPAKWKKTDGSVYQWGVNGSWFKKPMTWTGNNFSVTYDDNGTRTISGTVSADGSCLTALRLEHNWGSPIAEHLVATMKTGRTIPLRGHDKTGHCPFEDPGNTGNYAFYPMYYDVYIQDFIDNFDVTGYSSTVDPYVGVISDWQYYCIEIAFGY